MAEPMNIFLGFDPGGGGGKRARKGKFGWSICREVDGQLQRVKAGLAKEAWDALDKVKSELEIYNRQGNTRVLAAGIDAPLLWTRTGGREVDVILRQALKNSEFPTRALGGTVQSINSLQGSVVVQGILLVRCLWAAGWDSLLITESHPRVLEHILPCTMVQCLTAGLNANRGENHKRDATLCAVSAWGAARQPANWQNLYLKEPDPINPFPFPVSYLNVGDGHQGAHGDPINPFAFPVSYWMPIA